ncbi:MAG TPA: hypothetical protein VIY52_34770 [Streptosporangiaceae bacterium]
MMPIVRSFPEDHRRRTSSTLLTDPWTAGVTGWIVVSVAVIAELAGGTAVANQMSATLALLVLIIPVAVAFGFAVVQWWQVRSSGTAPAGWWHLGGIAAALLTWGLWPTVPGALAGSGGPGGASGGHSFCDVLPATEVSQCLHRAAQAADHHYLAWWSTFVVILLAALLARRSRIAAWAAIPAALAGVQLATFFLNQFVLYYHLNG